MAATTAGCTVAAIADSNAPATIWAWAQAPAAWDAAVRNQPAYGAAVASIAVDAGPCHAWAARPEVIEENDSAAESSSAANAFQATAASNMGAEPAPEKIRAEFISGGNTKKFMTPLPP
ncbi:hypothetical protein MGAST_03535 [Mycobacterium gastri 'Wayne']|uniref:Uncharacterized protein n=1 Tax=Mycobacterium gastri TaxID=1777 RepID=A0A1X1UW78_MYCGS|nr:hypothetical protein MGAST_03535 [Mycobacterium gastri 'Wayne']ORV61021.1 hypothetical protein AWC07_17465 [Mycobacterium gastri]